ncbi:MAG: DegT/DnrJ/EryC1/StrS family aminotransferase [Tannerellaceae bacterium]|jgi:dTDP-4-amino-4,6-dideoxygalactose transaminase|nr:DegT/DnrJ/EryC1/StrS family aminotransferase [Tannerellaceae bacterium]
MEMVDLQSQYRRIKDEIGQAVANVLDNAAYINGPDVDAFADELADYLGVPHVIPCANGTDALQIALMSLGLRAGDEVIVPAFTYAAAVEAIVLLGMTPVLVDVNPDTYNIDTQQIEQTISSRTKAIIVVHLFGQSCDMEPVMNLAGKYNLYVIEDNAQSLGALYTDSARDTYKTGTIGHIATTSFFPTKPLGCYGDGGALFTTDAALSERIRSIANHGQAGEKFHHRILGCNSRLDTLQAAILRIKLRHIDEYTGLRQRVARRYDEALLGAPNIIPPRRARYSNHVYHQYTIRVAEEHREALRDHLARCGIPTVVYYPHPINEQPAFRVLVRTTQPLRQAIRLSRTVLSLPIHSEISENDQNNIIDAVLQYAHRHR